MRTQTRAAAACIVTLLSLTHARAGDVKVLNGPILARFDRGLDEAGIPRGKQFGVFRAAEPRRKQDIVEGWQAVRLPGNFGHMGALALSYAVHDGHNGWWMKLTPDGQSADWGRYAGGRLIFRILQAPRTWKVELKTDAATAPVVVHMGERHRADLASRGYTDLAIPLEAFDLPGLAGLTELVIVFESFRLQPGQRSGTMLISQIGLSKTAEFSDDFDAILDDLARRSFEFFQAARHPTTGLVLDRLKNDASAKPNPDAPLACSVASVGWFLSLLPEWERLGFLSREEARRQAEQTLRFVVEKTDHHEGVLFHFVDWRTGSRWQGDDGKADMEASVLDHAICAHGAMTASVAYGGDVKKLTDRLLDRVDWNRFVVTDRRTGKKLLSLGWTARKGLLSPADVRSSEMLLAYMLAAGSKHPVDPQLWYNTSVEYRTALGHRVLNARHPLFTSMYGMNWHDLEGRADRAGVDLFDNARQAALLNRAFCESAGKTEQTYSREEGGWYGISAGDSPTGYRAAGPVPGDPDSVVWPTAAVASLPWLADEMKHDLPRWRNSRAWLYACGPFGLSPFRLGENMWRGADVIGIDAGSMAASIANYKNRTIWDLWTKHPLARAAYDRLGITRK